MKINKEWHLKNKMPKNPTFEERINWHIAHSKKIFPAEKCLTASKKK